MKYRIPIHTVRKVLSADEITDRVGYQISDYGLNEILPLISDGKDVTCAVIDSGVSKYHAKKGDLKGAVLDTFNYTSDSSTDDGLGHGTHVASTIGGRRDGRGILGLLPACNLLIYKALNNRGFGDSAGIAGAIAHANEQGVDFINGSFGSPYNDPAIAEAVQYAHDNNVLTFFASGNDGRDNSVNYPARISYPVGAVDRERVLAHFSSRGNTIEVCGPGVNIYAAYRGEEYAELDGTSMACPCVAAYFGALLQAEYQVHGEDKTTSLAAVREKTRRYAIDLGPAGRDPGYGWGILDVKRMIMDVLNEEDEDNPTLDGPDEETVQIISGKVTVKR